MQIQAPNHFLPEMFGVGRHDQSQGSVSEKAEILRTVIPARL